MLINVQVTQAAYNQAGYLRAGSIAVALYDFLQTWPAATRFYKEQIRSGRFTISFVLFLLLRIVSITVLVVSNVGFFATFTGEECSVYFIVAPIFKVSQQMVSQAILGLRAYNLSRRSRTIGLLICTLFTAASVLEWVTNILGRDAGFDPIHLNCTASTQNIHLATWSYYVVTIAYDVATTLISISYLLKCKLTSNNSMMSKLTKMMLYDGLGYFFVLTAVNFLNLFIYRENDTVKTAAASLSYCVTWIMSQRLLLHLHAASRERRNESINAAVTITQTIESARQVSRAMRSQFEQKRSDAFDLTVPDFDLETMESGHGAHEDTGVEVRIERTVRFEKNTKIPYGLENYSRPGTSSGRDTQSDQSSEV